VELHGERWKLKKKKEREQERPSADQPPPPAAPFGPWQVLVTPEAQKGYDNLAANIQHAMDEIMERLKAWPEVSGARILYGKCWGPGKYRMKTWDWRIEFQVDDDARTITVLRIGHRDKFYDEHTGP